MCFPSSNAYFLYIENLTLFFSLKISRHIYNPSISFSRSVCSWISSINYGTNRSLIFLYRSYFIELYTLQLLRDCHNQHLMSTKHNYLFDTRHHRPLHIFHLISTWHHILMHPISSTQSWFMFAHPTNPYQNQSLPVFLYQHNPSR